MSTPGSLGQEDLSGIVRPFANLMDPPDGIDLPGEDALVRLRAFYGAEGHADDFQESVDPPGQGQAQILSKKYLFLPFHLALGLHESGSSALNKQAAIQTFNTYASTRTLTAIRGGPNPNTQARIQRIQASAVLVAAILDTTIDHQFGNFNGDPYEAVLFASKRLLTHRDSNLLKGTAELILF